MSPTDRGHVTEASPTVTIIWKPGFIVTRSKRISFLLDECGRCSGGATGRVFHKRDCGKKCYANGTLSENFLDSCGICQVRKYARRQARDCNNDCSFGRRRACTNKCGICVGGKTGKALNDGR